MSNKVKLHSKEHKGHPQGKRPFDERGSDGQEKVHPQQTEPAQQYQQNTQHSTGQFQGRGEAPLMKK